MEGRGERKRGLGGGGVGGGGGVDVASAQQILLWFLSAQKVKVSKREVAASRIHVFAGR